jgi:MFS family permease
MAPLPPHPIFKSGWIIICGLGLGFISFLAGFLGPIFLKPESNLGPILGIFVTGPLGFLVGLLLGTLWSGWTHKTGSLRTEMRWLFAIWLLSALIYLLLILFGGFALLMVLGLQLAIVIVGGVLVAAGQKRPAIPPVTTKRRIILMVATAAMTLMGAFPPVKESKPLFIFVLDSGLDASMHVPDYTLDPRQLLVQWAFIASIAVATCLLVGLRNRGP